MKSKCSNLSLLVSHSKIRLLTQASIGKYLTRNVYGKTNCGSPNPISFGLPWWFNGKESACTVGDWGLSLGLRRSPREGYGHPLHYSRLENSMDRGAWLATVHGIAKRDMTEQLILSFFTFKALFFTFKQRITL